MSKHMLFDEFQTPTVEQWEKAMERFLKGKTLDSLDLNLLDGISIAPLQTPKKQAQPSILQSVKEANHWDIVTRFTIDGAIDQLNKKILKNLEGGITTLVLVDDKGMSLDVLPALFDNVYLEMIQLFWAGKAVEQRPLSYLEATLSINPDASVGFLQETNTTETTLLEACPNFCVSIEGTFADQKPSHTLLEVLKKAHNLFETAQKQNISIPTLVEKMCVVLPVGKQYLVEIAKLRAFFALWQGLLEGYDIQEKCFPKVWTKSVPPYSDAPYKNLIAATIQAMASSIGGANFIEVVPAFDPNKPDDFAERMARNIQHLLTQEALLNRVVDPAAGSYYIETLTKKIIEKTWHDFITS